MPCIGSITNCITPVNTVTVAEVEKLAGGDGSGRIQR